MPQISSKTFNIPFSGGAAIVVCLFTGYAGTNKINGSYSIQYNADGTTVAFDGRGDLTLSVSVNNGVMTAILSIAPGSRITDSRCCIIPGDPFA